MDPVEVRVNNLILAGPGRLSSTDSRETIDNQYFACGLECLKSGSHQIGAAAFKKSLNHSGVTPSIVRHVPDFTGTGLSITR